jgi:hypothetical protein
MSALSRPVVPVTGEPVLPRDLAALRRFAGLLDDQFVIPGTDKRFGLDALVGLVPGIGDVVGAVLSAWIVVGAVRHRVPVKILVRMLGNVAADEIVGTIPVLGDVFDLLFKENVANVEMLLRHRDASRPPRAWREIGVGALALAGVVVGLSLATLFFVIFAVARLMPE